jgi:hypothetical protein
MPETAGTRPLEEWRTVIDFPDYSVSNMGRVKRITKGKRLPSGHIMSPHFVLGYPSLSLCRKSKQSHVKIHSLVAKAFIGPLQPGMTVNHKDGLKTNNDISNLEYLTRQENNLHAQRMKLVLSGERCSWAKFRYIDIVEIRRLRKEGLSCNKIGIRYGVARSKISEIVREKVWRDI